MKDEKNFIFNISLGIFIPILLMGVWTTFIGPFNAFNSKESIKKTSDEIFKDNLKKAKIKSDEIFNSKLNEAKIKGTSILKLSDGAIKLGRPQNYEISGLVNFSAKITYDDFTERYQCRLITYPPQTVDPISKDIKIEIGDCTEYRNSRIKCRGKDGFEDYIQYRVNDEKNIRRYYPEIVIEDDNRSDRERLGLTYTRYKYYKVLPYSFFKDFEKIHLRYQYIGQAEITNDYYQYLSSKFDIDSVFVINNFQKRCGIKKSIFYDRNRANAI